MLQKISYIWIRFWTPKQKIQEGFNQKRLLKAQKFQEMKNIRFTEGFISKNSKEYIKYLNDILRNNSIGYIYKEAITRQELELYILSFKN